MNNIKKYRKKAGLTQAKLAESLGWKQSRIGNYETRSRKPDLDTARDIVDGLNKLGVDCGLDDVFPRKKRKQRKSPLAQA